MKSSLWYNNDITTYEGSKIDDVTSQSGLEQIIKEPTLIVDSLLCIDLVFTTQPNLVMESGVLSSLHSNCDHYIITPEKLNLIFIIPPRYEREDWNHQKANVYQIRQEISGFPWDNPLTFPLTGIHHV